MAFNSPRKPRICVLTYKALTGLVLAAQLKARNRAEISVDEYILDDAVARGRHMQTHGDIDVIVSAGSNAVILRSQLELPVVSIEVTGFDLLMALQRARAVSDRVGMVVFRETMPELDPVKDLLKIELIQLTYETLSEARAAFLVLKTQGISVVVGSSLIVDLAEQNGMHGVLVYTSNSIDRALDEAIQIGETAIRQALKYENLNAAFAHLHEAILTVDARHRITAINPLMCQILGLTEANPIGLRLPEVATELSLAGVLGGQDDDLDVVIQLRSGSYLMNRTAIVERGIGTGALLTLRDTGAIHRADSTIRSQRRPKSVAARYSFDLITGTSPALAYVRSVAERCARTSSTVLITGETGTGKELFAQAIHNASARQRGPFVALNCASFPEALLESELFGYEEGSFTGSRKGGRLGLFESAHTGTVFLDEIGDMPISLQTRLLRVLQEREVVRLGSNSPTAIDVRVIAATHRSLVDRVKEGHFRADLFYRLNILLVPLPPLRDRPEDLQALARQLLGSKLREMGSALSADAVLAPVLGLLQQYSWPGNIRELENVMERFAVFLNGVRQPQLVDYALFLREAPELIPTERSTPNVAPIEVFRPTKREVEPLRGELSDEEVAGALRTANGNRLTAAQALGISRTTLWRRLRSIELAQR